MSAWLPPILGIVVAFFLIKEREMIGNIFGDPEWLRPVGGIYVAIVVVALFIIFWSIAVLTGTTGILFRPFLWLFPTLNQGGDTGGQDMVY